MALTTNINVGVNALHTATLDLGSRTAPQSFSLTAGWTSGTGAGQADLVWSDIRTLAASATEDLDLAGTMLVDAFGANITFARVKMIAVKADPGNTNNVVIGGAAATQFVGPFGAATHTLALQPGAGFCIDAPGATAWAVTAGSTDFLRVANSAGSTSVTYSIMIVGASA